VGITNSTNIVVNAGGPTTTTLSTPSLAVANQPAAFAVTVTGNGGGTPTGRVALFDNGNGIGTGQLDGTGKATIVTSALGVGTHNISAAYNGDATFFASSSTPASVTAVLPSFADFPSTNPRPPASSLGGNWALVPDPTHTAPSFVIDATGAAVANNTASGTLNMAIVNDLTPNDVSVATNVKLASAAYLAYGGVMARMDSGFNQQAYVGVIEQSGSSRFSVLAIAQSGQLLPFNFANDFVNVTSLTTTGYNNVHLDVYGTRLSLFINGTLVSSEADTTLKTGGGTGIIDSGGVSSFQNFSATSGLSFADTFLRLGAHPIPTLGPAWSQDLNGGFGVNTSNQAFPNSTSGLSVSSVVGVDRSSVDVQATIAFLDGGSGGVVAQWNSATQSGYELVLSSTQVQLVKIVNGVAGSPLATQSVTPLASNNVLELQANGSTLTAYLNGQFLFTFTDNSSPFTSGSVGLAASGGTGPVFASFSVTGP
jgi:hypothetical protein